MTTARGGSVSSLAAQDPAIKDDYGYIWIPYTAFTDAGNAAAAAVGGTESYGLSFDAGTEEVIDTNILLPRDLHTDFDIVANVYFSSSSTGGSGVVWDLEYIATAAGEDVGGTNVDLSVTDTDSATADAVVEGGALTILSANITTGDLLHLALSRDANEALDTCDVDATLYGIRLKYTRRSL